MFYKLLARMGAALLALTLSASAMADNLPSLNGDKVPFDRWHIMVLPGETVEIEIENGQSAWINDQILGSTWVAPQKSDNHKMVVRDQNGRLVSEISVFILTPSSKIDKKGYIGKFRMGHYPKDTPEGFIRLDKEDMGMAVSPRFTVGQFICKQQPGEWPKYLVVSDDNLIRMETLVTSLNKDGIIDTDEVFVMSGFRSPFYNAAIGSAKYSQHMYGTAADIYIDVAPRDGIMDDLNGDGKLDKRDADFAYDYAEKLFGNTNVIKGGLGSYKANAVHGPFIHVDARGRPARWGRYKKPKAASAAQ